MATFRTFCYNPSPNPSISGTEQVGDIAAAIDDVTITPGKEWWNGPDETNGYIVAYVDASGNRSNATERILSIDTPCHLGFLRSAVKTEESFIELVNSVFNQNFTTGDNAKTWLNANGYWTSYGDGDIVFVTGIQTYAVLCRLPGDTSNWGLINLNSENNTATVRPLGLSRSEWTREDFYPLNESGYMLVFSSNETSGSKILFLDAAGNTVQTVDTEESINYSVHQGKVMSVRYSGSVWYFDGLNVYQYTYDATGLAYTEIVTDEDYASSNGTFMLRIVYNDGSIVIKKLYNGTDSTIIEYNSLDNYEIRLYDQADYYVIFKKTAATSIYQDFKIRKISDNTLLHSVDLTAFVKEDESTMDYKSIDFRNYGINKFAMIIHNWDDSDVDYRIYTYNGTTNVLNSTSHVKGTNYNNFSINANRNSSLSNTGRDSVLMSFYTNSDWNGIMNTFAYFDIVYQMSWQTSLTTYVFTNAGVGNETGILLNDDGLTNNYYAICTTNNTDLQVLSITEADGFEIITLGLLTDFTYPTIHSFGNKSCLKSYAAGDGTGMILKYFGNTGEVIDELTVTGTATYNITTYTGWNIFGIKHENVLYQINTTTDEIVTIGPWSGNNDYTSNNYYESSPAARQGDLVVLLFDSLSRDVIILKPTTHVAGTLPDQSDFNLNVGKNRFMYIFENPNDGVIQINLYDFNLTLINSIVTDKTNFSFSTRGIKDRFIVRHSESGIYTWYIITDTFDDSIMTSSSNTTRVENDWISWD
jgi:hypothetical protein